MYDNPLMQIQSGRRVPLTAPIQVRYRLLVQGTSLLKVPSSQMDLHESGIIGKPFKRTSTAIDF